MKKSKTQFITDLVNDCDSNDSCYIICTIAGNLTDYGRVPTMSVVIEPEAFSFQAHAGLVSFKHIQWDNLDKFGKVYDIQINEDNALNIAFNE